mgnify:CR=1 FL=1
MILQLAFVLTAIIIGARLGGIGLGVMGGIGLAILTFVFGLQPTAPPIDVMLMIAAVISAAACMQAAGGLDYMVKLAEHLLRKNPSHVTLLSPLVTYLFTFVAGTGHVEARDLTEYKVALIRDNIERSGLTNINAVCQDAAIYDPHKKETADIVIADLPCSGLGVLGKKPDLRYKMNEKTEADLVELQKKILSVVKDYVKPGGKLLYSTCTIHREENEGNVEWFLKEYPEFELVKEKQMIPGRDAGDGFYIAILKRVNHE